MENLPFYTSVIALKTSPKEVILEFSHGDSESDAPVRTAMAWQTFDELRQMLSEFGKELEEKNE